jgi:hypothetical protein
MNKKGFAPIIILIGIVAILAIAGVWYYSSHQNSNSSLATSNNSGTTTPSANSNSSTTTSSPTLQQASPTSGAVGTQITLTGIGFTTSTPTSTNLNLIYFGNNLVVPGSATTSDSHTLIFTLPQGFSDATERTCSPGYHYCNGGAYDHAAASGTYAITVENANGKSNSFPFTITSSYAANSSQSLYTITNTDISSAPNDGVTKVTASGFFGPNPIIRLVGNTATNAYSTDISPVYADAAKVIFTIPLTTPPGSYDLMTYPTGATKKPSAGGVEFKVLSASGPYITANITPVPYNFTYFNGDTILIQWKASGISTVSATLTHFVHDNYQYQIFSNLPAGTGSYSWSIPSTIPSGNFVITVGNGATQSTVGLTIVPVGTRPMQAP